MMTGGGGGGSMVNDEDSPSLRIMDLSHSVEKCDTTAREQQSTQQLVRMMGGSHDETQHRDQEIVSLSVPPADPATDAAVQEEKSNSNAPFHDLEKGMRSNHAQVHNHHDDDDDGSSPPPISFQNKQVSNEKKMMITTCPICFEPCCCETETTSSNSSSNNKKPIIQVEPCGHICCRECMVDYCKYHIAIHQVPVPCPMVGGSTTTATKTTTTSSKNKKKQKGCTQFLSPSLVEKVLNEEKEENTSWIKFRRLYRLSQDPTLVPCTRCGEVVAANNSTTTTTTPTTRRSCPSCQHVFCSQHGDAHPGRTCQDYYQTNDLVSAAAAAAAQYRQQQQSHTTLAHRTKPCSHCGAYLQKFAGCDHVVCPACHQDMCYQCGTHRYLTGKATRYCSQCQQGYLDHRYLWRIRLYYALTLPLALPVLLLYSAIAIVGIVLSACCCGAFGCGSMLGRSSSRDHNNNDNINDYDNNNNNNNNKEMDPKRGIAYTGMIIGLPLVLMMYDMGYSGVFLEDFVRWIMHENDDDNRALSSRELAEIPTLSLSSSTDD